MTKKTSRIFNIEDLFEDDKIYVISYCWMGKHTLNSSRIFNGNKLKEEIRSLSFESLFSISEVDKWGDIDKSKKYNKRENNIIVLDKTSNDHYYEVDEDLWEHFFTYKSLLSLKTCLDKLIELKSNKDEYIGFKEPNYYLVEGLKVIDKFPTKKHWFDFTMIDKFKDYIESNKEYFNEDGLKELENVKERMNKAFENCKEE